jgi:hypothetical protein
MTASRRTPEDEAFLELMDQPFSPLTMFVCTYEAVIGNINKTHEALVGLLDPRGPIKALNCNFGHKVQPGFERFEKKPKAPPPPQEGPPRGRLGGHHGRLAPAVVRVRKPQGDATCFNSALEVTVIPGPEDGMPPAVRDYFAGKPDKHYALKSFPTTGKTQVPGVVCEGLEDGAYIARLWASFLTKAGVAEDPSLPITVVEERPIMLNFKYFLHRRSERVILNLSEIADHLEAAKAAAKLAEGVDDMEPGAADRAEAAMRADNPAAYRLYLGGGGGLPFPVREIKHVQDGQNISFKFVSPAGKKVRVNVFFRGKVNILGAADFETPRAIHAYLSGLVHDRWNDFVDIQPLPDRVRRTRAAAAAAAAAAKACAADLPAAMPPPDLTIAADRVIADEDIDALLADLCPPAPPENRASPKTTMTMAALLSLALEFEEDFGTSDYVPLDHVKGQDVEDHKEDPLDYDAV